MKSLFAAASIIALLAGAPAWAQNQDNASPPHPAKPQAAQALNDQDKTFIKQASDGNLAEAKLGQLAMQKATSPAIKEFGRWMMTDHHLANVRLAAITTEIGAANFQPTLTSQDRELQQKLQGFSGEQFDRQYTQAMVRDHRTTIPRFRKEAQDGQNRLLKAYAHNLLPVLDQHLAEAGQLAGTAATSENSANSSAAARGMGTPPAAASENPANSSGTAMGMGTPPAAMPESSTSSSAAARGMGIPPGAASGSSSNSNNNPVNFYNR